MLEDLFVLDLDEQQRLTAMPRADLGPYQTLGVGVSEALAVLRGAAASHVLLRERLKSLAARFDDEYFQLDEEGQKQQSRLSFSKARATSALAFAMDVDDTLLHEAIYESLFALDDRAELTRLVELLD